MSDSAKIRLAFTATWALCVAAVAFVRPQFEIQPIAVNLAWPFVVFYLAGYLLESASRSSRPVIRERRILVVVALLVAVDRALKFACDHLIPLGESVPVVANRLHLTNFRNLHGSWISAERGTSPVVVETLVLCVFCVALAPLLHRFYCRRHGQSFWSVLAYVCFVAGNASGAIDLGVRGYVVDYLQLPGLFAVDLKDVYFTMLPPALYAEALTNPRISLRWLGWRRELLEFPCLVLDFARFAIDETRRIGKSFPWRHE